MILLEFYSKKIYRNKFNLILLVILAVIMGLSLYFNNNSNSLISTVKMEQNDLTAMQSNIANNAEQNAAFTEQIENNERFFHIMNQESIQKPMRRELKN